MSSFHVGDFQQGWESSKWILLSKDAFYWTKYQVSENLHQYVATARADSWNNRQTIIEILEDFERQGAKVSETLAILRQQNAF